jgi:peroxiredoxin Q/BCP
MTLLRLNEMIECERCHRRFVSYAALSQHFDTKHRGANKPPELVGQLAAERELDRYKTPIRYTHGPSKTRLTAFLLILIVAASVIGYVASTPREQTGGITLGSGSVAPDFTLTDVNGEKFTLSAYKGRVSVLLFFNEGLSCAPCLSQMTDLDQLNSQFSRLGVIVVSITGDPLNLLSSWAHSSGPQYSRLLSDQSLAVSRMYDMLGPDKSMMPGTAPGHSFVLVDKSGMIVWRQDYGPGVMYVPNDQVIAAVRRALGA